MWQQGDQLVCKRRIADPCPTRGDCGQGGRSDPKEVVFARDRGNVNGRSLGPSPCHRGHENHHQNVDQSHGHRQGGHQSPYGRPVGGDRHDRGALETIPGCGGRGEGPHVRVNTEFCQSGAQGQ